MVHAHASKHIDAPPAEVMALYLDYADWPRLFPDTIRNVRLLGQEGPTVKLEVDHKTEGKVVNHMTVVSSHEVRLVEWKRRYAARFSNRFEPEGEGTRYTVEADVALRGALRLLQPVARPLVRSRIGRYVLAPMARRARR